MQTTNINAASATAYNSTQVGSSKYHTFLKKINVFCGDTDTPNLDLPHENMPLKHTELLTIFSSMAHWYLRIMLLYQ